MTLAPGARVGVYSVVGPLGAGGMGEVYRARDTRLGRDVAIKVLPAAFTRDADRLARFDREARVLASLNHPGIAAIYGIEETASTRALVLELVDGGTLADLLVASKTGRGLAVDVALRLAREIAEALDAAHERGIVHRDLKPSNIGVTGAGAVKLLDFGLAKPETADSPGSSPLHGVSVASTVAATAGATIVGTLAYMSPEQVRGQRVDKRTDVWAFGCVLFEMLTGVRVYGSETPSDTIARILEREPEWSLLPRDIPAGVRRVLRRALRKDTRRRLRDIADVQDDLAPAADEAGTIAAPVRARSVEFQRLTDHVGMNDSPAISPDGKMVAFAASTAGRHQIWIQLLSGGVPLQVTREDADHSQPRWSPDSNSLLYHTAPESHGAEGLLWEVPALGGVPRPIISALGGGDVSHDGRHIAVVRSHQGQIVLMVVGRDGTSIRIVATVPRGHFWRSPRWSPDDAWLAFQGRGLTVWDERIYVVPASGGEGRSVCRAAFMRGASWLSDGRGLVYSSSAGSTLPYPPTFNLHMIDLDGSNDTQITSGDTSFVEPDVHHSGRLVVSRIRSQSDIWKFPTGESAVENTLRGIQVTRQTGQVQTPSVSPNGSAIVYISDHGGHANLWVARSDGSHARQITFERDPAVTIGVPKWSPSDDLIVYVVNRELPQLWVVRPDGRGARRLVERGVSAAWSLDGRWLYYTPNVDGEAYCVEKMPISGGPAVEVRGDHNSHAPVPGRDGLYYAAWAARDRGLWDWDICRASPEDGPGEAIGRVAGARLPVSPLYVHPALSPDGCWLALGLADGATTNIWALSTKDGSWRQMTDFGDQPTIIARQVAWSPDGAYVFAAVSKNIGDIVMFDGLV
jgi:serine/threonine protein kinase/WD40 repeat protein